MESTVATTDAAIAALSAQLRSLHRVALAVAQPGGQTLFDDLMRELAPALEVAVVFVAVFADDRHGMLQTLARA
jgi:hypothetical protein